jgi:NAD(P)-dependent dehydrogenase (short-subunit alcohol dehydrogenase family)
MVETPSKWGFGWDELATMPTVYHPELFKDKTVLISGAGSGMGKVTAFLMARLGAQVMICGRSIEKLETTAQAIKSHLGIDIGIKAMSIRDPEQVGQLFDETFERFGGLDIVVNSAGGQFPQAAIDYSVKGWNAVIDTNLNGTWYMMQAAARRWRERGAAGNIVNIVAYVERGLPQIAHTCAAKAGVIYLSKSVAVEWAPLNIRVNCLAPGSISTEGLDVYPAEASARFRNANPMRHLGDAWDIAQGVIYLAAPSGKFITGELLTIDGGYQMWGNPWPGGVPDHFNVV